MDLLPGDLGSHRLVAVVAERARSVTANHRRGVSAGSGPVAGIGFLGRYWLQDLDVDDATGRALLGILRPLVGAYLGGFVGGFGGGFGGPAIGMWAEGARLLAMIFGCLAVSGILGGLAAPGITLRRWVTAPLGAGEVDSLLESVTDDLERAYLLLVRDSLRQTGIEGAAADELREAIRALGEALDRLPSGSEQSVGKDPVALRIAAEDARSRAAAEPDAIVAASLERQAEALDRSAAALEQSSLVLRRAAALRQELAAQTEALRLGLSAHFGGVGADASPLTQLAASARGVAREASSLAAARAELDAVSAQTASAATPPDQSTQRLGR